MSIESINLQFAKDMEKIKPAVVITAEINGEYFSDCSRPCNPSEIKPTIRSSLTNLNNQLYSYSGLYTNNGINIIGNCAEVNAAAKALQKHPNKQIVDINFSKALRPRTKQNIDRCNNCVLIFGEE